MNLFTIEQSKVGYWADFAFYGATIVLLALVLVVYAPSARWVSIASMTSAGLVGWSVLEYLVHRFVFHGIQPMQRWHAEHHARPTAFICAPTLLTASLLGGLLFVPAWLIGDAWSACALLLGVLAGYLAYALTHHAIHHGRAQNAWLRRRQRWHFIHHRMQSPCCYGVTSGIWDIVCGSTRGANRVSGMPNGRAHPEAHHVGTHPLRNDP